MQGNANPEFREESSGPAWLRHVGLHRRELRSWALYDWANSAFATTIMAAVLPIYYADVAAADLEPHLRTAYWGYTTAAALIVIAVLAPILGAVADHRGSRKKFLASFMVLGVTGTAALVLIDRGEWLLASLFFIVGNIGFAGANVFYDALLPHIADEEEVDQTSTAGYALGYLGGGLLLAINLAWILKPDLFGFADAGQATRAAFASVAIWWAIFAIPLFKRVREPATDSVDDGRSSIVVGVTRLIDTFRKITHYKHALIFLVAFWFYSDGIGTVIKMATIYGREMGIGKTDLIGALLLVQFLGIPATFAFGYVAQRFTAKAGIMVCLAVYTVICMLGYFMHHAWQFWALAILVAMVQGGSQGLSRSLFARMVPRKLAAEFFGFFSVSSKFAGIFGPLLFGIIAEATGGSRNSILFLISFFIIGGVLLWKVDVGAGQQAAANPHPDDLKGT